MAHKIDCQIFDRVADDLARDELAAEEALAFLEHAKGCVWCARRLESARLLTSAFRQVEAGCEPREAPPEVEHALRNRFRQRANLVRFQRRRRQRWIAGAIAAGVLLIAGAAVRLNVFSGSRRAPTQEIQRPAARAPISPAVTSPSPAVEAENIQPDESGGFLPLPYAEGAPPVNEEQVVRVNVPAAALSDIGLPVSESSQYVTADILIGDDGIARAIRIVQ